MNDKNLILKKQTLVDIADAIREKTGSVESIAIEDLDDAVAGIQAGEGGNGGGLVEVDELQGPYLCTPVPNSGYVEKVYFDTSLSIEQVVAELEKLTYDQSGGCALLINNDYSTILLAMVNNGAYIIVDDEKMILYFSSVDMGNGQVGWNSAFNGEIEVNSEVVNADSEGLIGVENDKIANLFYLTKQPNPQFNPEAIYKVSNTPVPNSGPFVPIYFNRSLSIEEVIAELNKLTFIEDQWGGVQYVIAYVGGREIRVEKYGGNEYSIWESQNSTAIFDTTTGWSPYDFELNEFNNLRSLEYTVEFTSENNGYPVGNQNHLINNLFSIDSYPAPLWKYDTDKWQQYKKTRKIKVINNCSDSIELWVYPDGEHIGYPSKRGTTINSHYPKVCLHPNGHAIFNVVNTIIIDNSNGYSFYNEENASVLQTDGLVIVSLLDDKDAIVYFTYPS